MKYEAQEIAITEDKLIPLDSKDEAQVKATLEVREMSEVNEGDGTENDVMRLEESADSGEIEGVSIELS